MATSRVALFPEGLEISRLVYGVFRWQKQAENLRRLLDICLDQGVTTFDHADIYGSYQSEELFGRYVPPSQRQRMEFITKCGIKLVSPARPHHRLKS